MFERAASQLDTDFDWWALVWLVEGTGASNPHLERLVETAQRVRAPSLQAFAALYEGHHLIQFAGPAGVNEAAAKYHEALTIARGVRNQFVEGEALRAHLFAIVQAADDDRAALRVCRDVLTSLHESRRLDRLDTVLRSTALLLARSGSLEAASVIFGRVQANLAGWGYEYNLGFDDEIIRLTASDPARQRWVARGSHMTLDEAVLYALDQLPTDQEQPARRVTVDVGERDVESAGAAGGPG
jgi:hypothetical protein